MYVGAGVSLVRAAEFWLYFPNQKLQPDSNHNRRRIYFFQPLPQGSDYFDTIDRVAELSSMSPPKQVSQFEAVMRQEQPRKRGHYR